MATFHQLNPMTPMAFLPPSIAYETTISAYILVGSLGAFIWDILSNLNKDYKLLFKYRLSPSTVTYFFSRLTSLLYVLLCTVFKTAPVGHCQPLLRAMCILYPFAVSSTALLFFFRICAIFNKNKFVIAFFFAMWLMVVGGSVTILTSISTTRIGPTDYCLNSGVKANVGAAGITSFIHDTLVFLAISWRILSSSYYNSKGMGKASVRSILMGSTLPAFSRAILLDGQVYYLATVGSNLLIAIMVYVPGAPTPYRAMFSISNVVLTNAMACHVYRNTKFGLFKESSISTREIGSLLGSAGKTVGPVSVEFSRGAVGSRGTDYQTMTRVEDETLEKSVESEGSSDGSEIYKGGVAV